MEMALESRLDEKAKLLESRKMAEREGFWIPPRNGKCLSIFGAPLFKPKPMARVNGLLPIEAYFSSNEGDSDGNYEEELMKEVVRLKKNRVSKREADERKKPPPLPSSPQLSPPSVAQSSLDLPSFPQLSPPSLVQSSLDLPSSLQLSSPSLAQSSLDLPSSPPAQHSLVLPTHLPSLPPAQSSLVLPSPPPAQLASIPTPPPPQCPSTMPFLLDLSLPSLSDGMERNAVKKKIRGNQKRRIKELQWLEFSDDSEDEKLISRFRALDKLSKKQSLIKKTEPITPLSNKSTSESKMRETRRSTRSQGTSCYGSGDKMWFVPPDIGSSRRKRNQLGKRSISKNLHRRDDLCGGEQGDAGGDGDSQHDVEGEDVEPGHGAVGQPGAVVDSCSAPEMHDDLDITTTPGGRKYIRIAVDNNTSKTPGRRRGKRTRVAPVKTWENHKIDYNTRRKSGLKIDGILVPHKKKPVKRKEPKKFVFRDDDSFTDFERVDTDGNIFTEKLVHTMKSGVYLSDDKEDVDCTICSLFQDDFTSQGFITISVGGMKERCRTSQHQFSFLVMKGHVMFQINEQKYDVAAGEAVVRVPTGVCYLIENLDVYSTAELYYYARLNYHSE